MRLSKRQVTTARCAVALAYRHGDYDRSAGRNIREWLGSAQKLAPDGDGVNIGRTEAERLIPPLMEAVRIHRARDRPNTADRIKQLAGDLMGV